MRDRLKYSILLLVFIISFVCSLILAVVPTEQVCGPESSGCSVVQTSPYSEFLGISNSYFGIVAFLILIGFTISELKQPRKRKRFVIQTGLIVASGIALYFIYLQIFVIGAFCKYCMIIDVLCLFGLALAFFLKRDPYRYRY